MDLELSLDRFSPVPITEQIRAQLRLLVVTGRLEPGEALPTIKQLAARLEVNPNTVSEVYGSLEAEGYLSGHKRGGTRVAARPPRLEPHEALASQISARMAREARAFGLTSAQLARWVTAQGALEAQPKIKVAALGNTAPLAQRWAAQVQAYLGDGAEVEAVAAGEGLDAGYAFVAVDPALLSPQRSLPGVPRALPRRALSVWDSALYEGPQGAD